MTGEDPPDLDLVWADESYLTALDAGELPDNHPLTRLLAQWRDSVRHDEKEPGPDGHPHCAG
jgi:hypothetical protein